MVFIMLISTTERTPLVKRSHQIALPSKHIVILLQHFSFSTIPSLKETSSISHSTLNIHHHFGIIGYPIQDFSLECTSPFLQMSPILQVLTQILLPL